ncbi:nicotinate-nucleotide adenylyltransferase [Lysobacter koreensis]|uniref:Probable nicotinate-nucleotide adenylyltransferase n=1 Tax=Lysobacter koreensis TaxID=266122 RepID=A0ABW2YQT7_9GAMM
MTLQVFYGGTFDPVHCGHLAVARAVRDGLQAPVRLLPAADPPHKGPTHADAQQRARMLDLATAGERGLVVDRRELRRPGPSYSIDTLRELREELGPQAPIAWLIGSDSLAQLHTWHRWRELFELAHILVVTRPGTPVDAQWLAQQAPQVHTEVAARQCPPARLKASPAGGLALFGLEEQRPESSTELRRRIAAGEPWQAWVPPAVAEYIARKQLYAVQAASAASL